MLTFLFATGVVVALLHAALVIAPSAKRSRGARGRLVWLQASTATIYAHRYDAPNDESSGVLGGDEPDAPSPWRFSIDAARASKEHAVASMKTARMLSSFSGSVRAVQARAP